TTTRGLPGCRFRSATAAPAGGPAARRPTVRRDGPVVPVNRVMFCDEAGARAFLNAYGRA
ncbi:MAG TPA: hypothetical protein VHW42_01905, partial [Actinomycetes bacterium]|nr:hypothetical protein [Actinomycetes bacterium]